ncbi:DUF2384 domain-containing protein [Skermanella mucosa]|uniref:antitoxin Xre/MbcA/ParS toxin-binding domain-containing protein n=1 Tax=Skermanella mucosa TaxID=1789672 RepID=UPI00192C61BD|nr:antitoxin Xre/MbcA/ParS toxin-binding domain-containing protein [Skermanella mucosa]UEM18663.1 DUF2384 domain-containing protein [Skermanella mucosa]
MAESDLWLAIEELRSQQREMAAKLEQLREEVSTLCAERDGTPDSRARSVVQYAELTFDTHEQALAWLQKAHPELDGLTPLEAARRSAELNRRVQGLLVEIVDRASTRESLEKKLKGMLSGEQADDHLEGG